MFRKTQLFLSFLGIITFLGVIGLLIPPATTVADSHFTVIADGLDNPRGLAFGADGSLYVAEAGRGGDGPCVPGPEGDEVCLGLSGAVTRVKGDQQERIITDLPSLAPEGGNGALGPEDVSLRGNGAIYVPIGLGLNPSVRDDELGSEGEVLGQLLRANKSGNWKRLADLAAFEAANDPDAGMPGTEVDSNPKSVVTEPGGQVVADAGANDLLKVSDSGKISLLAVFDVRFVDAPPFLPPGQIPMQPVPTSVIVGPDGAYYVGELTGFPFPVGAARVYRVVEGQAPEIYAEGFTNIIDIAFDSDGNLYVLEIATNGLLSGDPTGALIRVNQDGSRDTIASEGLITPAGLAIGSDGALYVSNCGTCAGAGAVIRIEP